MRARQLNTSSPLVRATQAGEIGVSNFRAVRQLFNEPLSGGLIMRELERAGANSAAITNEETEFFMESEIARREELGRIEYELQFETDQVRRQSLLDEYDAVFQQRQDQQDFITQTAVQEGRMLSVDQVIEEYNIETDRPMSRAEAEIIANGRREQEIRNAIIAAAPRGILPGAARFGASILNFATDPVELASMFIPVVGAAGKASYAARFGRVGGAAATGAVEGGVGSLLTEPLYFGLTQSQQLDYTMQEALFNIGAGIFLGGGIGTLVGAFSRTPVNVARVREASAPETQVISGERIDPANDLELGEQFYDDPARAVGIDDMDREAFISQDELARRGFREDLYGFVGGSEAFEYAIRRLVNDRGVDVSLVMPRAVPRPQTISDFIRQKGGINDNDPVFRGELQNLGIRGFNPYSSSKGNQVNGISNPRSNMNLDDMAELAQEAGFIRNRDKDELIEALRSEGQGNFVFAMRDQNKAARWREYNRNLSDFDAEQQRRDDIRAEFEAIGYRDLTDDEVALMSSDMANGKTFNEAAMNIGFRANEVRAQAVARDMANPASDPLSDFEASMRADMLPEDFDWEQATNRELEILRQMEVDGTLTAEQRALADEIAQIDERADTYIQAVQAAAVCVTRT